MDWFCFGLGLFMGANIGIITFAIFAASKLTEGSVVDGVVSKCCHKPVTLEYNYRCTECGHFCNLVKEV